MPPCLREVSHVELRPRLHVTQTPCVTGFRSGDARLLPLRSAYRRGLRPYLARCLTAVAKRTGGDYQSRIWFAVGGVEPEPLLRDFQKVMVAQTVCKVNMGNLVTV